MLHSISEGYLYTCMCIKMASQEIHLELLQVELLRNLKYLWHHSKSFGAISNGLCVIPLYQYHHNIILSREKYQDTPGSLSIYQNAPESFKFIKLPL